MRKLLFRSRSGEGYPMVIAVTLCLLMLFMVIAEYFRVNIIVQGVRDAVQQAVIATVTLLCEAQHNSVAILCFLFVPLFLLPYHITSILYLCPGGTTRMPPPRDTLSRSRNGP